MRVSRIVVHRCRSLFQRSRAEAELQQEMELHIQQLVKEHIASGMTEAEALLSARRDFGPVGLMAEQCRDMRGTRFLEETIRDLTYAFRALAKSPAFTLTALLSLALGIGANTAIYSFLDAIMMRALPVPHPQDLVVVNWRAKGRPAVVHSSRGERYEDPGGIAVAGIFPYPFFESLRNTEDGLSSLFAFAGAGRLNLVAENQAFLADGEYVSGNYFNAISAPPAAGRLIDNADDRSGAAGIAVISYRLWQLRFHGSPRAVGQKILISREPFIVAGVTAPEFFGVNPQDSPDIFLPLHTVAYLHASASNADWFHERNTYWVHMMGRLRPGVTLEEAQVPLAAKFHLFAASTATNDKERKTLPAVWLQEGGSGIDSLRRQFSKPLYVLLTMTVLLLAIACANIANLLLARGAGRRREIAVRLSMGASRARLVRQLLTESVLLALLGGLIGLLVAACGIRFLTWLLAHGNTFFALHAAIDFRILLFAVLLSVLTGILCGLVPALEATKADVAPGLKEPRTAAARSPRFGLPFGLGQLLVAGQIALSLVMVVAAGLFVKTLIKLHSVSIGFNTEKLLVFSLDAGRAGYDQNRAAILYESLRQRFAKLPGVRGATMTSIPLASGSSDSTSVLIPGMPVEPDRKPSTSVTFVGPSFFETMQIPVLLGRSIGEQDTADAPRGAVVNEVFAKKFFVGLNPIGRHFAFEEDKTHHIQIVGVARNSLYESLKKAIPPAVYLPWSQWLPDWVLGGMYYEIRTLGDPLALTNTVRQIVHEVSPSVPVADLRTQVQYIEATITPERTFADLCTCFGLLALLIACVGLYGSMAYSVARRTHEIGIRMALGAQRGRVIWMVQREVLVLSAAGLAIGLSVAWGTAHFVASFLFGVRPNDPTVFLAAAAILLSCALAAGYVPAWRASRIDPAEALRNE